MKKLGLALSGGGFRASLYHLGLARFLRDAGILPKVTHITSVSGGSIFAAHLVLNWARYNGSVNDFDGGAAEFLRFIRMDVRNRVLRRFPFLVPVRLARRLFGYSNRRLTLTGLLEKHYEAHLYGDTSLFELPENPVLHILATNVSEGCLCSFNRHGIFMMRRHSLSRVRINRIHAGLATVAMAVTASSAFPGLFPPLELMGMDVGAKGGEFGRQAFTDGGVYDNLGVRMFRWLERPLLTESRLSREDFHDLPALIQAFRQTNQSNSDTPLHRLAQVLVSSSRGAAAPWIAQARALAPAALSGDDMRGEDLLLPALDHVLRHHPLQHEPEFADLQLVDSEVQALLRRTNEQSQGTLEADDQLWLNRHLLEAAFQKATGQRCFRHLDTNLDGVLVSDVGKPFEVQSDRRGGGLIRIAMRATDILMDRVWQLENETFEDVAGFVFARMTDIVEPHEDPTAPIPDIQRQAAQVRTDLDRFSPLEISALVRHGYCVGRKACRAHPDLFGTDLPKDAPWDPTADKRTSASVPAVIAGGRQDGRPREPSQLSKDARTLQASATRRIWSALLDYRDWPSYIYAPIIVPLLLLTPYLITRYYRDSLRLNNLVESLSQGSPDLAIVKRLLDGPEPQFVGEPAEEVSKFEERNFKGFEVLQDSRILDLRNWNPSFVGKDDPKSMVYGYRRLKIHKLADEPGNDVFRIGVLANSPKTIIRFPPQELRPKLRVMNAESDGGEKRKLFEASIDLRKVTAGTMVDLIYEHYSPAVFLIRSGDGTSVTFHTEVDTAELTRWFFMPAGKEYETYRTYRYPHADSDKAEPFLPVTRYLAADASVLAYKMLALKAGQRIEVQWSYK
jgi:predicted acylesterase/phospholipase RssA